MDSASDGAYHWHSADQINGDVDWPTTVIFHFTEGKICTVAIITTPIRQRGGLKHTFLSEMQWSRGGKYHKMELVQVPKNTILE